MSADEELAAAEAAYRKAIFKMVTLGIFIAGCCAAAVAVRKVFGLPPALLSVVFIIALLLFSPDIFRFLLLRNKVQHLRKQLSS